MAQITLEDLRLKDIFYIVSGEGSRVIQTVFIGKITYVVKGKFPSHFIFPQDMYYATDSEDHIILCIDRYKYFRTYEDATSYVKGNINENVG